MLLPKPLRGSVNRALPDGKAEVNLGRRQGVFVGLELYVEDAGFGFVVVRSVDDASCIVAPKYDDLAPEFKTGQRVFSSLMDRIND